MDSPISQLTLVLEQVRATAKEYADVLHENEAATRAALIDPVLRALGWDIGDPRRVIVEKIQSGNKDKDNERADYLLQADGEAKFVIEAKKLNANLKEHFVKLAAYSVALGVGDIFITDGIRWRHYQNIGHNNQEPKCELNMGNDPLSVVAAYLVQNLDAALFVSESPVENRLGELAEQISVAQAKIETLERQITKLIEHKGHKADKSHEAPIIRPTPGHLLSKEKDYTNTKPSELILPDGRELIVSTWKDALVACCRFALTTHPVLLTEIPLLDQSARRTYLIQEVKPASRSSFAPVVIEDKTYWVHTNYSSNAAVSNCLYIIEKLPVEKRLQQLAIVLATGETS